MTSAYMRRAIELAESVAGTTSPNPNVGCVLVRDGAVVGEGATRPPGQAHAEIVALEAAGDAARGATAYVTLEPCSHTGRTAPCADALIAAGVAAVHAGVQDPNPRVAGEGIARLRAAGIEVTVGDGASEISRQLEAFLHYHRAGRPFVIAKFAATLDGKIAAASGDSRWVAGEEARAWAHAFRARVDAIMCGVNNVLLDDPQLTARPGGALAGRQPLRIVADSRGRTPLSAKVLNQDARTVVATTDAAPRAWRDAVAATGAEVLVLPADGDGRVDLRALVEDLAQREVLSLLVEGGGVLHASFFAAGLVDKVHAIIAPKIVGGTAYPAVAGEGAAHMADAVMLQDVETHRLGDDVAFVGYLRRD
ncbi:MAG TPA: bifunctional diaminohydroxyphosphoribosylaminopyrimidine deaminase/5-amino-6-(5-phosphoribosylamino)uracil reductase RibD [Candidatus Tectomicrobia bacterium]|nr:bifunctional diaminohydroxyphosphoribosylaminopyrimidine deaminase/5-amino-6-(5-phosphoribosylamino)uracil reductase RibD [Candidatus Tectomicrobia bacterium]